MPRAKTNGIEVEYETFGDAGAAPLLLVGGLGVQLVGWMRSSARCWSTVGFT